MASRLSVFFVWAALAASALFWGLRLSATSPSAPPYVLPVGGGSVANGDLTRLLGAEAPPPSAVEAPAAASSRFQLSGVVAPRGNTAEGIALIAVDGKPPRPFRVGASVDGNLVVRSVDARHVRLGLPAGGGEIELGVPALPMAATGTLPNLMPPPVVAVTPTPVTPPPVEPPSPGRPPESLAVDPALAR
jgi:general secretion pathway protein C